jgi:hypothetical protein
VRLGMIGTSMKCGDAEPSSAHGCSISQFERSLNIRTRNSFPVACPIPVRSAEPPSTRPLGPVLTAALCQRFSSRDEDDFPDSLLSAMRYQTGGHLERPVDK